MTSAFVLLYLLCLLSGTEANTAHLPRMIFTHRDIGVKRISLPGNHTSVQILRKTQFDTVISVTPTHQYSHEFHETRVESKVLWKCSDSTSAEACSYNMAVIHEMEEANHMFVCGTNGRDTQCCEANFSSQFPSCSPTSKISNIDQSIRSFIIKEGEPTALDERGESADLYVTRSGLQQYVGIHKFGKKSVRPVNHKKEQYYVGLMLSRRGDSLQDRVYAFYKEKNRDTGLSSDMWIPFVTQVCMSDIGGPKNVLQQTWTSQMDAKLFCGDLDTKQHFSELVDVAIVHADEWQDTRVYGLFRNEWGMSAVCVFKMQDIDQIFKTSPFKDSSVNIDRSRECVADSTKLSREVLRSIEKTSEMEEWVQPVSKSGPVFSNRHNYTHLYADNSIDHHTVLFLSLNNGGIHKVILTEWESFLITEYRLFNHHAHILSILQSSSRKLYVHSGNELVQLDVENCGKYGDSCEDCLLARDPYCYWTGTHCLMKTKKTEDSFIDMPSQSATTVDQIKCPVHHNAAIGADETVNKITLPFKSKYFLRCTVFSHHAQYCWHHNDSSTLCSSCSSKDQDCLLLIDGMSPEKVGTYTCVSVELGYIKVQAQYDLQLENRAVGPSWSPLLWCCLMMALIASLSSWS